MRIHLQVAGSKRIISLNVEPFETIRMVKAKIDQKEALAVDQQWLIFGGVELDDERSMNDYNIQNGSTLNLYTPPVAGGMKIFVRTVSEVTRTLDVNPYDTIESLKHKIFKVEPLAPAKQKLAKMDHFIKQLDDQKILYSYNIAHGSTLYVYPADEFYVFIRTLVEVFPLLVDPLDSVVELRSRIQGKVGIPTTSQRFIFAGRGLFEGCSLADFKIQQGSTIYLLQYRLHGGWCYFTCKFLPLKC